MWAERDGQYLRDGWRGTGCGSIPLRNKVRVSLWEATHCRRAKALQTLLLAAAVSWEGLRRV